MALVWLLLISVADVSYRLYDVRPQCTIVIVLRRWLYDVYVDIVLRCICIYCVAQVVLRGTSPMYICDCVAQVALR